MSTEKKLLEVGDVVYETYREQVRKKLIIDRVTATMAFCRDYKFKRTIEEKGYVKYLDARRWDVTSYYIETPELKDRWDRKTLLDKLDTSRFHTLTTEQLRQIVAIIEQKPEA